MEKQTKKNIINSTVENKCKEIFEFPEEKIEGIDYFYVGSRFDGCVGELFGCSVDFATALWECEYEAYRDSNYVAGIYFIDKWIWSDNEDMYINIGGFDLEGFMDELPVYAKIIENNGF